MPNHIHVLIDFIKTHQTINLIIGNGKRFMAYNIIKRLKEAQQNNLLDTLAKDVEVKERPIISNAKFGKHPSTGNIATVESLSGKNLITYMLIPVRANGI